MFKVSNPICTPPETFSSALQQKVYSTFQDLSIPFERVDTDPGLTMEDCQHIDAKIGVHIVKTVFLCNRQQTEFWLYVTSDDKPFVTREFCGTLGILSCILPSAGNVNLVMDRGVAEAAWFACTDGTPTCFVKLHTQDLLQKYIPASGHSLTLI